MRQFFLNVRLSKNVKKKISILPSFYSGLPLKGDQSVLLNLMQISFLRNFFKLQNSDQETQPSVHYFTFYLTL